MNLFFFMAAIVFAIKMDDPLWTDFTILIVAGLITNNYLPKR